MKKFRKLIVALLAMTMALGCLTMTASAADYTDSGKLYIVGAFTDWKHTEMTGKDGVYTYEVKLEAGTFAYKFTPEGDWNHGEISPDGVNKADNNFSYEAAADGTYVFTIDTSKLKAGDDDTRWNGGDAVTVAPKGTAPDAGVSAPVVVAAIAVVSMVGIVVFTKRRTVAE